MGCGDGCQLALYERRVSLLLAKHCRGGGPLLCVASATRPPPQAHRLTVPLPPPLRVPIHLPLLPACLPACSPPPQVDRRPWWKLFMKTTVTLTTFQRFALLFKVWVGGGG